jgi:GTP1/Obg family GTP-binding protein
MPVSASAESDDDALHAEAGPALSDSGTYPFGVLSQLPDFPTPDELLHVAGARAARLQVAKAVSGAKGKSRDLALRRLHVSVSYILYRLDRCLAAAPPSVAALHPYERTVVGLTLGPNAAPAQQQQKQQRASQQTSSAAADAPGAAYLSGTAAQEAGDRELDRELAIQRARRAAPTSFAAPSGGAVSELDGSGDAAAVAAMTAPFSAHTAAGVQSYRRTLAGARAVRNRVQSVWERYNAWLSSSARCQSQADVRDAASAAARALDAALRGPDSAAALARARAMFTTLKRLNIVNPRLPTVALVGAPNVGKSSLVRVLSTGRPEVQNFPFTTRAVSVGHLALSLGGGATQRCQVTDTPGLLNRPDADRKSMELLTLAVLEHVPALAVLFVIDPSGHCGTSLEDQLMIRQELRWRYHRLVPGARWFDVATKTDVWKRQEPPTAAEAVEESPVDAASPVERNAGAAVDVALTTAVAAQPSSVPAPGATADSASALEGPGKGKGKGFKAAAAAAAAAATAAPSVQLTSSSDGVRRLTRRVTTTSTPAEPSSLSVPPHWSLTQALDALPVRPTGFVDDDCRAYEVSVAGVTSAADADASPDADADPDAGTGAVASADGTRTGERSGHKGRRGGSSSDRGATPAPADAAGAAAAAFGHEGLWALQGALAWELAGMCDPESIEDAGGFVFAPPLEADDEGDLGSMTFDTAGVDAAVEAALAGSDADVGGADASFGLDLDGLLSLTDEEADADGDFALSAGTGTDTDIGEALSGEEVEGGMESPVKGDEEWDSLFSALDETSGRASAKSK